MGLSRAMDSSAPAKSDRAEQAAHFELRPSSSASNRSRSAGFLKREASTGAVSGALMMLATLLTAAARCAEIGPRGKAGKRFGPLYGFEQIVYAH